jgi:hypothetical protein
VSWFNFILLSFVCYRLAQLFVFDEGPFSTFHQLRVKVGAYDLGDNGKARTGLGRAFNCPYCLGIWIALPLAFYATGIQWSILVWWVGIAGGQAFLQGLTGGH